MAACLIALGSNLGDRACHLRRAVEEFARAPHTVLIARSSWRETPPVGGPAGQGSFLNGAVLASTQLEPPQLLAELVRIELLLGRQRRQRWEARTLDLDVLLYDAVVWRSTELAIPHPRMSYRRFVLEGAAEAAPWMIDPESGWTVARLLEQLDHGADEIAVAGSNQQLVDALVKKTAAQLEILGGETPRVRAWTGHPRPAGRQRPKLIVAPAGAAGLTQSQWRKMAHLPATGPIAWLHAASADEARAEALVAIASVWPAAAPLVANG